MKKTLLVAVGLAVGMLAGCDGAGADSTTPRNVLPEAGSPVMYEFYTDT